MEPDLRVILGTAVAGEEEQVKVMCYSQILSRDSEYVKEKMMLTTPTTRSSIAIIANENDENPITNLQTIHFPDVSAELWKKAMSFLEPGGSIGMTAHDDISVVLPLYIQYQFRAGIDMCDRIMERLLKPDFENFDNTREHYERLSSDDLCDVISAAKVTLLHRSHLPRSYHDAVRFSRNFLQDKLCEYHFKVFTSDVAFMARMLLEIGEQDDDSLLRKMAGFVVQWRLLRMGEDDQARFSEITASLQDNNAEEAGRGLTQEQLAELVRGESFGYEYGRAIFLNRNYQFYADMYSHNES